MEGGLFVLTLITALGCGLVAGAFFAFSSFVMAALGRLPSAEGMAAMQSINVLVINPVFMSALFGTAATCLATLVWTAASPDGNSLGLVAVGVTLYLAGVIGVTMGRNVPLNNRLAATTTSDAVAPALWSEYLKRWTAWNHIRALASLAAAAALTVALAL